VVSLVILIAGLQAIRTLSIRQYPRSENASITVTTIYVGASADLVRGFITTPLERAIAAADGIDYLQSQSAQGVSTITARLKLNYDGNKALSDISTKVDAERNNLPPESEVPVIKLEPADSQFASAYLSFTSDVLQPNEVTDYLVRIVQPRLSAISGVQRADILGGALSRCVSGSNPTGWRRLTSARPMSAPRWRTIIFSRRSAIPKDRLLRPRSPSTPTSITPMSFAVLSCAKRMGSSFAWGYRGRGAGCGRL
jgi:hypothetical protein